MKRKKDVVDRRGRRNGREAHFSRKGRLVDSGEERLLKKETNVGMVMSE